MKAASRSSGGGKMWFRLLDGKGRLIVLMYILRSSRSPWVAAFLLGLTQAVVISIDIGMYHQ